MPPKASHNPFKVISPLGESPTTTVALAEHPAQRAVMVVVKTIHGFSLRRYFDTASDCVTRRVFESQLAALRRVRHPNVLQPIDIIDDPINNKMHQVTAYIGKIPLMQSVGGSASGTFVAMDEGRVAFIALRLLSALRYLHRHGFVHGAIKPSNLLTDEDGGVYLGDVGGARWAFLNPPSAATPSAAPQETPWSLSQDTFLHRLAPNSNRLAVFNAPELWVAGHSRTSTPRTGADVWSLGVLLYTMISGRTPHEIVEGLLRQRDVAKVHLPMPPNASQFLKDCLKRMLVVDPLQRCSVEELRQHGFFREAAIQAVSTLATAHIPPAGARRFAVPDIYSSDSTDESFRRANSMSPLLGEDRPAPLPAVKRTTNELWSALDEAVKGSLSPTAPHQQFTSSFKRVAGGAPGKQPTALWRRAWRRVRLIVRWIVRLQRATRKAMEYRVSFHGLIPLIVVDAPPLQDYDQLNPPSPTGPQRPISKSLNRARRSRNDTAAPRTSG
jgi:serine/threonine protein kinase